MSSGKKEHAVEAPAKEAKKPESAVKSSAPPTDQTTKKAKVAPESHVYAKPAAQAPVSFFVTNPKTSDDAFIDNPGFAAGAEDSGDSSSEEEKQPAFSLFANAGTGPLSSWSFSSKGEVKPLPEAPKLSNTSLFVPLPPPSKPISLFDSSMKEHLAVNMKPESKTLFPVSSVSDRKPKDDPKPSKPSD